MNGAIPTLSPEQIITTGLQEVEYGGAVNEFGPVRSSEPGEQQRSFLPFIQ